MVKDKNKPKRGLTAFMFFSKERRDALKVSDPKLEFGEIAKKIGAEWKTYDDKKKAKYVKLSDKDKARYLKEMKSYVPPPVSASDAKKKKKRKKDPNAPKRSKSAYMFYATERRPTLVVEKPGLPFGEYGKLLGEEWRAISSKARDKYDKLAEKDKARYIKQMKSYKAGLGNL